MDFLRINNKLLYLLSFDQNKVYSPSNVPSHFGFSWMNAICVQITFAVGKEKTLSSFIRQSEFCCLHDTIEFVVPHDAWPAYIDRICKIFRHKHLTSGPIILRLRHFFVLFLFEGNLMFTVVNLLTTYNLYGIHYVLWFWWFSSCLWT